MADLDLLHARNLRTLNAAQSLRDDEAPAEPDEDTGLLIEWATELSAVAYRALEEIGRAERQISYGNLQTARALLENAMNTMKDAE